MDDKTNITLWRELGDKDGKSVTEFKHITTVADCLCKRCKKIIGPFTGSCIPAPYPGTKAGIAEKIVDYMVKAGDGITEAYITALGAFAYKKGTYTDLLPAADKTTAFVSLFESEESNG